MHLQKNKHLTTILLWLIVIGVCLFGCATNTTLDVAPAPVTGSSGDRDLGKLIESIRIKEGLPALAAAVIINGKIHSTAAVGTRKLGTANWVTVNDKFIIGSCGKTFTATLAAILGLKKVS